MNSIALGTLIISLTFAANLQAQQLATPPPAPASFADELDSVLAERAALTNNDPAQAFQAAQKLRQAAGIGMTHQQQSALSRQQELDKQQQQQPAGPANPVQNKVTRHTENEPDIDEDLIFQQEENSRNQINKAKMRAQEADRQAMTAQDKARDAQEKVFNYPSRYDQEREIMPSDYTWNHLVNEQFKAEENSRQADQEASATRRAVNNLRHTDWP